MAAPARLPIPAQWKPGADPSAPTDDAALCVFSAESACAQAPLTSEPPLPDAEPLTSEPPLAEATPLTSESDAFAAASYAGDPYGVGAHESGAFGARP
ncbi:hypothetical protein ABB07_24830 [Streptomyces incarnatus]|uniref:Uncharacterized protein n=1 Tax=Streptomyces incarnatus TaxID=665007 RepID=A0ABN4GMX5_9ACTN|nr:hypothetical protein [Streptomyces incarnatus]AKJ13139.1 hypothetical protein ABB07_24830 [Streptomyces incarnatus]